MTYTPIEFTIKRPLLDLRTCVAVSNSSSRELLLAIESGEIRYAFNLSTTSGRREVRVLANSLADYVNHVKADPQLDTPTTLRALVADLFPALSETIAQSHFARVTCCASYHVTKLVRARLLTCAAPAGRSGPRSSARIWRYSAVNFLISRRVLP